MTDRKRPSTYTASFRVSLTPAVKAEIEARAAAAGISSADAARQYLDVGLATAALGTKDEADADMAQGIVRAVAEAVTAANAVVVNARNAAMAAPEDDREQLDNQLIEIEHTRGYGALEPPNGYDPWGLTEEDLATARERAVSVCERLSGRASGLADVLALIRQKQSPAFQLGDMHPFEEEQMDNEVAFLIQVVIATADDAVYSSELNRIASARARLIDAATAHSAEEVP